MADVISTYGPGFNRFRYDPSERALEVARRRQEIEDGAATPTETPSILAPWVRGRGPVPGVLGLGLDLGRKVNEAEDRLAAAGLRGLRSLALTRAGVYVPEPETQMPDFGDVQAGAAAAPAPPGEPLPDFGDVRGAATSTAIPEPPPPRAPIRAIRLPGGKIVFSNLAGAYGPGVDVGVGDAVREIQRSEAQAETAQAAAPVAPRSEWGPHYIPPYNADAANARALVHRAALAASAGAPGGVGVETARAESPMPERPGATVSTIEGSEEQQRARKLEDIYGLTALAQAQTGQEIASMSPLDQARLGNKEVVANEYLMSTFRPLIDGAQHQIQVAQAKIAMVTDPNDREHYIPDQKQRDLAVRQYEDEIRQGTDTLGLGMSMIAGRSIYRPQ